MAPLPISAEEASSPEARSDQRLLLVVAVVVTVLDLFSKWSISRYFEDDDHESSIELIGNTITLRLSENDGIAFGLFQNQSVIVGSLVALGVLALVVVGWRTAAFGGSMIAVSFGLLIGGAFGNLLDRLSDGHVTDFIVVGPWPSFNLADSAITVGAILLLLWLLLDRRATPTGVK